MEHRTFLLRDHSGTTSWLQKQMVFGSLHFKSHCQHLYNLVYQWEQSLSQKLNLSDNPFRLAPYLSDLISIKTKQKDGTLNFQLLICWGVQCFWCRQILCSPYSVWLLLSCFVPSVVQQSLRLSWCKQWLAPLRQFMGSSSPQTCSTYYREFLSWTRRQTRYDLDLATQYNETKTPTPTECQHLA